MLLHHFTAHIQIVWQSCARISKAEKDFFMLAKPLGNKNLDTEIGFRKYWDDNFYSEKFNGHGNGYF